MKKIYLSLTLITIFCCLWTCPSYGLNDYGRKITSAEITKVLISHINLINNIIKNPKAACMKNWTKLSNPSDEKEEIFYINSISDGTPSQDENSKAFNNMQDHLERAPQNEPSVLLQYLRLALLAYNVRAGSAPPEFTFLSFKRVGVTGGTDQIISDCSFKMADSAGHDIQVPAKIVFDLEIDYDSSFPTSKDKISLYLSEIYIKNRLVYGWQY
jgi:hypothetical protein